MSIYRTAYDTTAGKGIPAQKITNALKEVLIQSGSIKPIIAKGFADEKPYTAFITGRFEYENIVPAFINPIEVSSLDKEPYLFSDVRSFVRADSSNTGNNILVVKNKNEFDLARAKLAMGKIWLTAGPEAISGLSPLPCNVFCSWISEGISHKFALDPLEQLQLAVISCFYYQSLFVEESEFDKDMRDTFNANCIRILKAPAKIVFETTDKITTLSNVGNFCTNVQTILSNPRLIEFNSGLLITILKSSWFGVGAAEMLAVSLEHPPTWVSLVFTSLSERSYRNSNLAKISERYGKGNADGYFTRGFVSLAKQANAYDGDEANY